MGLREIPKKLDDSENVDKPRRRFLSLIGGAAASAAVGAEALAVGIYKNDSDEHSPHSDQAPQPRESLDDESGGGDGGGGSDFNGGGDGGGGNEEEDEPEQQEKQSKEAGA